jgi:hypothetical protein
MVRPPELERWLPPPSISVYGGKPRVANYSGDSVEGLRSGPGGLVRVISRSKQRPRRWPTRDAAGIIHVAILCLASV